MSKKHVHLRLEIEGDLSMLHPMMASMVDRLFREAGSKLVAQTGLLADPETLKITFEEWTPEGYQPCVPIDITE